MKIAGFTIIRNAVLNDYPVVEAIRSILPIVDEMVVCIGDSEDGTEALVKSIDSGKIRIVPSVWNPSLHKGGQILAVETDKAFAHVSPDADWAFYIQGDEVIHEKYHAAIREAAQRHKDDRRVEGLVFDYVHFYGTYDYIGDSRRWYRREVRIIRNDKAIKAYRDAQGFRREGKKLRVQPANASVYHYGWVKSPAQMKRKLNNVNRSWDGPDELDWQADIQSGDVFDFSEFDSMARFGGTHPQVIQSRIAQKNWRMELDTSRKKFSLKEALLYFIEKNTGKRLFEFRNYRLLK